MQSYNIFIKHQKEKARFLVLPDEMGNAHIRNFLKNFRELFSHLCPLFVNIQDAIAENTRKQRGGE